MTHQEEQMTDPYTVTETTDDGTETVELTVELKPMNPEAKTRWVEALRSDRFRQARGVFFEQGLTEGADPKHCCLAVLTDVYIEAGGTLVRRKKESSGQLIGYDVFMVWHANEDPNHSGWVIGTEEELAAVDDMREISGLEIARRTPSPQEGDYLWMRLVSDLPVPVAEWAGLSSGNPMLDPSAPAGSAIHLNDGEMLSYEEIADRVEEHL